MRRVLLVCDVEGWAFHHWAKGIQKYAPDGYDVQIITNSEYGLMFESFGEGIPAKYHGPKCDAVFLMMWNQVQTTRISGNQTTLVASPGIKYDYPIKDMKNTPSLIATKIRNRENAEQCLPLFDRVLCTSNEILETAKLFNNNSVRVTIGVDTDAYRPSSGEDHDKVVVGWCGQPNPTKGYDLARNAEKFCECYNEMYGKRFEFSFNTASHQDCKTQEEMVEWYNSIDVFLTTGCAEGGPSPPLEAMACGVPVFGTESGFLKELVSNYRDGFLTPPYHNSEQGMNHVASAVDALCRMSNESIAQMQHEARQRSLDYCWKIRSEEWLKAIFGETE